MSISSDATSEKEKTKILFYKSPVLLFLDFTLRISSIVLLRTGLIKDWLFWVLQILIITGIFVLADFDLWIFTIVRNRIRKKYIVPDSSIFISEGTGWLIIIFVLIYLGYICMPFYLYPNWHILFKILLLIGLIVYFAIYCIYLYMVSDGTKPKTPGIIEKSMTTDNLESSEGLPKISIGTSTFTLIDDENPCYLLDKNDEEIIEVSAEIKSSVQRVDTFTLESALFGGLAFSGFLSLLSSEKPIIEYISTLTSNIPQFFVSSKSIYNLFSHEGIFALITIETIICSMLFLSVIIARLRFNDIVKKTDQNIGVAQAYNDKEEEILSTYYTQLINNDKNIRDRVSDLNSKARIQIEKSRPLVDDINAVVSYMRIFRSLGIACFVLILVTAALFVSEKLSLAFVFLYIVSMLYLSIDKFARGKRFEKLFESKSKSQRI